ncbi:MAG: IS1634 family transposase [Trueperaceae bacterium]
MKSNGVEYVQLAHNEWVDGKSRTKVVHGFGRKDRLDQEALKRLISSISRFLAPDDAASVQQDLGLETPFEFLGAKEYGGTFLLNGLWERLGIGRVLRKLAGEREFGVDVERLLFALVAQRALAPGSKLAAESWVNDVAFVDGLPVVEVQQLYRAMDFLLAAHDDIQREVFWSVKNLFNLEVDLIFVDTTSTYFEIEGEDADGDGEEAEAADTEATAGLRKRGYSKDSRADLAQAVLGFAVTRDGIPVRCWVWPGNTVDVSVVEEVKKDLNDWKLGRVIMVMDTGFNSAENRRTLQGAGDAFIIGEKMRLGRDGTLPEALTRAGRYKTLANGLRVKEVIINQGSVAARRFVVVHNPEQAERDAMKRNDIIAEAERRLTGLGDLTGKSHTKAVCDLRAHKVFGRYLRELKSGALKVDKAKIAAEAKLDGKYLISTSDEHLSVEDVVLGYKQLHEIERVNRDLKHTVDVRPVYHRRGDRIKAHVLLCWLALLLIRIAENESGESWHQLKKVLRPLLVAEHQTQHGVISQTNKLTAEQKRVLDGLNLKAPKRYLAIPTPKKG